MKLTRTLIALMLVCALLLTGCGGSSDSDSAGSAAAVESMQDRLQAGASDAEEAPAEEAPAEEAPAEEAPAVEEPADVEPDDVDLGSFGSSGAIYEDCYFVCTYQEFAEPLTTVMDEFGYSLEYEGIRDGDAEYYLYDSDGNDTGIWLWIPIDESTDEMEEVYMILPEGADDTTTGVYGVMVIAACTLCDPNFSWDEFDAAVNAEEPTVEDDGSEYVVFDLNDVYYMVAYMDGTMCINIY